MPALTANMFKVVANIANIHNKTGINLSIFIKMSMITIKRFNKIVPEKNSHRNLLKRRASKELTNTFTSVNYRTMFIKFG